MGRFFSTDGMFIKVYIKPFRAFCFIWQIFSLAPQRLSISAPLSVLVGMFVEVRRWYSNTKSGKWFLCGRKKFFYGCGWVLQVVTKQFWRMRKVLASTPHPIFLSWNNFQHNAQFFLKKQINCEKFVFLYRQFGSLSADKTALCSWCVYYQSISGCFMRLRPSPKTKCENNSGSFRATLV